MMGGAMPGMMPGAFGGNPQMMGHQAGMQFPSNMTEEQKDLYYQRVIFMQQ